MCPCDLSIPHKQYRENCQNHAAWVMLIFLAHFFQILLGMSLICKTTNNPNSSGCWWWMVTTTYWRLTLTVGQKLVYPFGTYVISAPPGRIHRGKGGAIQPIVSLSFSEGTIDNLLQACVNFFVVVWDKVSLYKPCWPQTHGGPSLSFSEHHILLMPWLYERAVMLAHPSMPGMVLSDLWSPECGPRWTQSITVFQHDSVVRDIYSQLKPCSKFWIMDIHPTSKRQSLTVRQCWVPTEVSSWSCHFKKEQPWLYTANCTGKVAYLPRSVIKRIFCSFFQVIMGLFGNTLRNIFLCMHVVVNKTN